MQRRTSNFEAWTFKTSAFGATTFIASIGAPPLEEASRRSAARLRRLLHGLGRLGLGRLGLAIGFALLALSPSMTHASDNWPTRPVTIVVPFVAGGNTDMMARLAAERLAAKFHQPFVIENRGGAGGVIAAGQVARSAPDGYTFLFGAGSQLTLAPLIQKISYDPDKDLIPVTEFGTGPQILGVKADMPVNTLQEFIDYAKARPGKLSYAGVGMQTVTAIAAGVLNARAGLELTLVPYKGGVQAVADLVAGHVDVYFGNASEMLPHLGSERVRLLAVATPTRIPQAPNLPAVAETLPGFQFGSWNGFMVPAGTPQEIIDRLVEGSIEAVNTPSVKEKLVQSGIVPGGTTPAQVAERFKADKKAFAEAVQIMGLKPE
jgi:tripartite-type tricarboxylate transporter receptor subunit TctC